MDDVDGTDTGSFVGGYLDREATEARIRDTVRTGFENGDTVTRSDLEDNLPRRSHVFISATVRTLAREGFVEVNGDTYRPGPSFD